jgi:hypothetical protein
MDPPDLLVIQVRWDILVILDLLGIQAIRVTPDPLVTQVLSEILVPQVISVRLDTQAIQEILDIQVIQEQLAQQDQPDRSVPPAIQEIQGYVVLLDIPDQLVHMVIPGTQVPRDYLDPRETLDIPDLPDTQETLDVLETPDPPDQLVIPARLV